MKPKNNCSDRILFMGIGNYLMGDEGIGVHVANKLYHCDLPSNVDVVDGGTGGFHLLEYFELYEKIVLVDATLDGNPAGTIRLIKPRFASDFPKAMSTHDIGLKDMMSSLQLLDKVPEIYLFVVSIETIQQQGVELTEEMEAVMPSIIQQVCTKLQELSQEVIAISA